MVNRFKLSPDWRTRKEVMEQMQSERGPKGSVELHRLRILKGPFRKGEQHEDKRLPVVKVRGMAGKEQQFIDPGPYLCSRVVYEKGNKADYIIFQRNLKVLGQEVAEEEFCIYIIINIISH